MYSMKTDCRLLYIFLEMTLEKKELESGGKKRFYPNIVVRNVDRTKRVTGQRS